MKRNLLTVLILALLIVNLILTGIVMFSTVSANRKTTALVTDIATVLNLELGGATSQVAEEAEVVPIEDTEVYNIEDQMTVALKKGADGTPHYALVEVSLSLNTKDKTYKEYQPMLATKESLIKGEIIDVIGSYTKEEAEADSSEMEAAILKKIQAMFGSEFVFGVTFRNINFQ